MWVKGDMARLEDLLRSSVLAPSSRKEKVTPKVRLWFRLVQLIFNRPLEELDDRHDWPIFL